MKDGHVSGGLDSRRCPRAGVERQRAAKITACQSITSPARADMDPLPLILVSPHPIQLFVSFSGYGPGGVWVDRWIGSGVMRLGVWVPALGHAVVCGDDDLHWPSIRLFAERAMSGLGALHGSGKGVFIMGRSGVSRGGIPKSEGDSCWMIWRPTDWHASC